MCIHALAHRETERRNPAGPLSQRERARARERETQTDANRAGEKESKAQHLHGTCKTQRLQEILLCLHVLPLLLQTRPRHGKRCVCVCVCARACVRLSVCQEKEGSQETEQTPAIVLRFGVSI